MSSTLSESLPAHQSGQEVPPNLKRGRTNNIASVPSVSRQPTGATTQSQTRRATVQTEEEESASRGEDIEDIEVGPDTSKESSSKSGSKASEDELGQ